MKHDTSTRNQGTHHTLYYAESWIVMHYLLHEKKLPETGAYFDLVLNQHVPVEDAIQQAFGMSSAQLEQAVKEYFHAQTTLITALDCSAANQSKHRQPRRFLRRCTAFRLPSGRTTRPLRLSLCPKPMNALSTPKWKSGFPNAATSACRLCTRWPQHRPHPTRNSNPKKKRGDPARIPISFPPTRSAVRSPTASSPGTTSSTANSTKPPPNSPTQARSIQRDMWLRYYMSVLKYRVAQAKHADIQGLPNMMLELRAVLEWYPEMADAYDLLGGRPQRGRQHSRRHAGRARRHQSQSAQ